MQRQPESLDRNTELFEESFRQFFEELGVKRDVEELSNIETKNDKSNHHAAAAVKLDIQLKGEEAGVKLVRHLADKLSIPFVFIKAKDHNRIKAAASVAIPREYLHSSQTALLQDLSSRLLGAQRQPEYSLPAEAKTVLPQVKEAIFIRDDVNYVKVRFHEIDFVKSDGNYIEIHRADKNIVMKKTLKSIEEKLPSHSFYQVHRSYLVNIDKITSIGPSHVVINEKRIPISKGKKDTLLDILGAIH